MVKSILKYSIIIILFFGCVSAHAQHDTFARVKINPRQGVVKQAYKVTISVYTSTWYTQPLEFSNLHIDNAFIIPFTRTLSSMSYINGKGYATLTFYYLVFPYKTGDMLIPPLDITATTPPEGESKAAKVNLKTKEQTIKVKTIPSTKDALVTMVANDVHLQEKWNKPLIGLKVGDVIERTINISANGTLPSLISPFNPIVPDKTSLYARATELKDRRNATEARGLRTERYAYLFEEEGIITIPKEEISWYNPTTKRVYKRSIEAQTINIAPNPDLAMMQSLKDSLQALNAPIDIEQKKKTFPWQKAVVISIAALLIIYVLRRLINLIKHLKQRRIQYLQSETFYFKQLLAAINNGQNKVIIQQLYRWYDQSRSANQPPTITSMITQDEQTLLESILAEPDKQIQTEDKLKLKRSIKNLRKQLSNKASIIDSSELNPV